MRRTIEIISAGGVALGGLLFGLVAPVSSTEAPWDAQTAVLSSFSLEAAPEISIETARTATAIMSVRQSFNSDFAHSQTRFVLADPPGPGELVMETETLAEEAFQRAVLSGDTPQRLTTNVRVAAPITASESDAVVTPYAGLAVTPEGAEARLGARFQVGDGRGHESRWFLFAAAERQALFYDTMALNRPLQAVDLVPYSVIGDIQAGVAYRLSQRSDVALAYVRRDWAYHYGTDDWEETEEFAAVSVFARW
jgi:hypothetical protein